MKMIKQYPNGQKISIRINWKITVNHLIELVKRGWQVQKEAV
jgi:hypothetical protein